MITLTREEAQQVLDALNSCDETWVYDGEDEQIVDQYDHKLVAKALETLRARLAQPELEPVAWMHSLTGGGWQVVPEKKYPTDRPLYTAPPQREWQGLTEEEIMEMLDYGQYGRVPEYARNFVDAIEAKLKEKNNG